MRILAAVATLIVSSYALSCPDLLGTWRSSKEMSMEYNEKFAHLEPNQKELLVQILGRMIVTYTDNKVHEHGLPSSRVTIGGKEYDFAFEDLSYSYKVLSCDKATITAEFEHPHSGPVKETAYFIDENTYWISSEILPSTREYFIRVSK